MLKYRTEIDGLRAVAVVPVILFHAGFSQFNGGFVGVDIFFVISGYLITSIILRDVENGSYSLVDFYERRARRILPALFLVSAFSLPFAIALLLPLDLKEYFYSLIGVSTFSSNLIFYAEDNYFATNSEFKPLLHTWSLAVEEQYYLLYPPLLVMFFRWKRSSALPFLAMVFLSSIAFSRLSSSIDSSFTFYMLPTRAWELALGGLLAVFAFEGRMKVSGILAQLGALSGICMIVLSITTIEGLDFLQGMSRRMILACFGAALVIHSTATATVVGRILSIRPLVLLGLVSYSAYLWHQPLFAFSRHFYPVETPQWVFLPLIAATFVLAYLSWCLVEGPFRERKRIAAATIFKFSIAGLAALLAIGVVGARYAEPLSSIAVARSPQLLEYRYDNRSLQMESWTPLRARLGQRVPGLGTDRELESMLRFDESDPRKKIFLVGNSHSKDLYNALHFSDAAAANFQLARFGTQIADLPSPAMETQNYQASDIVIIASRYRSNDISNLRDVIRMMLEDGKQVVIIRNIFEMPEFRSGRLNSADIHIIDAIEAGETDGAEVAAKINRDFYRNWQDGQTSPIISESNIAIDEISREFPEVLVFDRMDLICAREKEQCFALDSMLNKYFYDYGHTTIEGAEFFGERIDQTGWLVGQLTP